MDLEELRKTIPSKEDYAAIGSFVASCSSIESCLHSLIRVQLNLDEELERRLVGEPRHGDLASLAKDVCKIKKLDRARQYVLENAISWAGYINTIRAIVAHKPVSSVGGQLHFSNETVAKSIHTKWVYKCSRDELKRCGIFAAKVAVEILSVIFPDDLKLTHIPKYDPSNPASLRRLGLPDRPPKAPKQSQK